MDDKSNVGHTHTVSDITGWEDVTIKFNSIDASGITVDGKNVSVEGHTHPQYVTMQEIKDAMNDEVDVLQRNMETDDSRDSWRPLPSDQRPVE